MIFGSNRINFNLDIFPLRNREFNHIEKALFVPQFGIVGMIVSFTR